MRGLIMLMVVVCGVNAHASQFESPVPEDEWSDSVKLWTARSVLGEVGWDRPGEWAAVLWVYANRAKVSKRYTFYQMVRKYSAAVKRGNHHRNPWLFNLGFNKTKPVGWPASVGKYNPLWRGRYDDAWIRTLKFVERWKSGQVENPCPTANHFGGYVDRHRAEALRWTRIKCREDGHRKFRNRFYDSTRKVKGGGLREAWRFRSFGRR